MANLLIRLIVFLGSAAIGLLVAVLLIDDVEVSWVSFLMVVVIFAVLQAVFSSIITPIARDKAPALIGVVGLVTTLAALALSSVVSSGLRITGGIWSWVLAAVVVWIATLIATALLPRFFSTNEDKPQSTA